MAAHGFVIRVLVLLLVSVNLGLTLVSVQLGRNLVRVLLEWLRASRDDLRGIMIMFVNGHGLKAGAVGLELRHDGR